MGGWSESASRQINNDVTATLPHRLFLRPRMKRGDDVASDERMVVGVTGILGSVRERDRARTRHSLSSTLRLKHEVHVGFGLYFGFLEFGL